MKGHELLQKESILEPLVSVIVPVYNVEKYIKKSVDSLINQTLQNIEIILIDDGSTDESGQICDEYTDPRVQVIHQPNLGVSVARNRGIEAAKAQWIMFVDGDDWVEPEFCEIPYRIALNYNCDLVFFRYRRVSQNGAKKESKHIESKLLIHDEAVHDIIYNGNIMVWNKMYRAELFSGIRFPDMKNAEDAAVIFRKVDQCQSIYRLDQNLYNYYKRSFSASRNLSESYLKNCCYAVELQAQYLASYGYNSFEFAQGKKAAFAMDCLARFGKNQPHYNEIIQLLYDKETPTNMLSISQRFMLPILRHTPHLFDLICILMGKRVRNEE